MIFKIWSRIHIVLIVESGSILFPLPSSFRWYHFFWRYVEFSMNHTYELICSQSKSKFFKGKKFSNMMNILHINSIQCCKNWFIKTIFSSAVKCLSVENVLNSLTFTRLRKQDELRTRFPSLAFLWYTTMCINILPVT